MARDIAAPVEAYQGQDGKQKKRYMKIGVILEGEHGEFVLLDPTVDLAGILVKQRLMDPQKAGDNVLASIFDDNRNGQAPGQDVPF
jgi:hypothetical protein